MLTPEEVREIALRTRKLQEVDLEAALQKARSFSQKIRKHESLTSEEQISFLRTYAFIRDIALLKPYLKHLSHFNITEEKMRDCNEIAASFETLKLYPSPPKIGLFEKLEGERCEREEVVNLFSRLASKNIRQLKAPQPKR